MAPFEMDRAVYGLYFRRKNVGARISRERLLIPPKRKVYLVRLVGGWARGWFWGKKFARVEFLGRVW